MVDGHVVEEGNEHDEIGLRGLVLFFLMKMRRGCLSKDLVSILIY